VAGILERITDGFFALDPEWRFTYANATGARLLGLPHEALMGKVIWDLFPVAVGTRFSTEAQRAVETQAPVHFDEFYPEPLNAWFECHCYPSREGLSVFFRNITERRRTEDTLAAQRHLLRMLFESAAEGITVRDAQGRVTFVNAVARQRALLPPEGTTLEMAPQVWGESRDAEGKPVPLEDWPISRALRGESATAELERVTPQGSRFIRNSAAPLRNDRGEIIGLVAITTDLTDRKRMEDQLRQALRNEEAARADNLTLLREVHHRTKNNLQMLCDLLYLQMEALQDAGKRAVLQDTYGRIYAIARLHEQLYLSMQSGQVQLDRYFARLLDGCKDLYPAVPVVLEAPGEPLHLDLDRAIHAGLILNELVTNAAKHAFPDGRPGAIVVRLRAGGDRLELSVHDNGVGLPANLDVPHAKSLGLRIVHILARRLQASITAENDQGAAFTIAFPRTPEE
jgi:PAS domain S-box-containing protein